MVLPHVPWASRLVSFVPQSTPLPRTVYALKTKQVHHCHCLIKDRPNAIIMLEAITTRDVLVSFAYGLVCTIS